MQQVEAENLHRQQLQPLTKRPCSPFQRNVSLLRRHFLLSFRQETMAREEEKGKEDMDTGMLIRCLLCRHRRRRRRRRRR